jgi:hypothetical protein
MLSVRQNVECRYLNLPTPGPHVVVVNVLMTAQVLTVTLFTWSCSCNENIVTLMHLIESHDFPLFNKETATFLYCLPCC